MRSAKRPVGVIVTFAVLLGASCALAQDWPQWRGPNRDNKVADFTAPKTWPKELTKKWRVSVGVGEASPLLVGDKIYVFGRQGGDEVTLCLNASDGKEVWKDSHPAAKITGSAGGYPGPRSTPAVGEGKVCTLGVHGVVSCLDAATGKLVWRKETGAKPMFYTSTSPLIADGKCIVYVSALTAYDLANGESKWSWSGGGTPYGSPVLVTIDDTRQVVTPTVGAIAGINLADGKRLWQATVEGMGYTAHFSTPVFDGQTIIYSAAAKGGGKKGKFGGGAGNTMALKIEKKGDAFNATELWKKSFAAHQYHTPLLKDGLLFGVTPSRNFFCADAKTGEQLWKDDAERGNCGSILDTGSLLVALTSDKDLVVFKAGNKQFEQVAKYRVADSETWSVPIIAGNRIFVKDKGGSLTLWTIE